MKNNLAKLFAVSSLVAGGSILAAMPANAIEISLGEGDEINIATYGALFTGEPVDVGGGVIENTDGAVITKVEHDDNPGFPTDFIPSGSFATADINSTNIDEIENNYTTNIGVVEVKSFDLTDTTFFTPIDPPDFDFDPTVNNRFSVSAAFGNFVEIEDPNIPGQSNDPDLAIRLLEISTTQSDSLLETNAEIGVGFTGLAQFITFGPNGQETVLGTGSFSSTIPANGTNVVEGTAVYSFEVQAEQVPESSPVSALIGLGLFGSAFALKKKIRVS